MAAATLAATPLPNAAPASTAPSAIVVAGDIILPYRRRLLGSERKRRSMPFELIMMMCSAMDHDDDDVV